MFPRTESLDTTFTPQNATLLDAKPGPAGRKFLIAALAIIAASIGAHWYTSRQVFNPDPILLAQWAKEMLQGGRLYSQVALDKGPFAMVFYGLPQLFVPRSYTAIAVFLGIVLGLQGLAFYAASKNKLAGLAALSFVVLCPLTWLESCWAGTEHFSNVFVVTNLILGLSLLRTSRVSLVHCLLIGLATTLAFHTRQNAFISVLAPLGILVTRPIPWKLRLKGVVGIFAGGLAGMVLIVLLVLLVSDLKSYFFQVFVFPFKYAGVDIAGGRIGLFAIGMERHFALVLLLFAAFAMASKARWATLWLLVVGIASCITSPREFGHYWVSLFPFIAMVIVLALDEDNPAATQWIRKASVAGLGVVWLLGMLPTFYLAGGGRNTHHMDVVVGEIHRVSQPDDTLYVFAPMSNEYILFASKLRPAHMYYTWWDLDQHGRIYIKDAQITIDEYHREPPTVFVIDKRFLDDTRDALTKHRPADQCPPSIRIAAGLLTGGNYRTVGETTNYVILRRQTK